MTASAIRCVPLLGRRRLARDAPHVRALPLRGRRVSPGPALALLAAVVASALVATHTLSLAWLVPPLAAVGVRAARHAWIYPAGIARSAGALCVRTPCVETTGTHSIWSG